MSINSEVLNEIDFSDVADGSLPPVHPGEILREEFLRPLGLTAYRLAKDLGVAPQRINEILAGKRAVTADTGLRLSHYFGLNDGFWVGLQTDHDLAVVRQRLGAELAHLKVVDYGERRAA
jgi:addiction module HigA family antidote